MKPNADGLADLVEVHVAQHVGHRAADDQAEQHGDGGHEAAEDALDRDDDRDGAQRVEEPPDVGGVRLVRCPGWSTASIAPTGTRHRPMMVISVPVTTGGKNRSSLMKIGAIRNVKTPATITAP